MIELNYKDIIPNAVKKISDILNKHNFQCYLVGGAVRDYKRGCIPKEFDIATNALPENVISIFKHTVPTGIKHGTILVIIDGMHVEVTTFRADGEYTDGRRPDTVSYSKTIEEDLSRRDFTINAMALNLQDYSFVDLFNGQNDLNNKIIKTVGNPYERFKEDGLRIMRAIRFSSRFDFNIEEETYNAMLDSIDMIERIANERIREEFNGILLSNNTFRGIEILRETGILDIIMPELMEGYGVDQNKYHKYDIYYHNLRTLEAVEEESDEHLTLLIKIAALFHDVAKPFVKKKIEKHNEDVYYNHEIVGAAITKKIMRRLKYSNSDIDFVTLLIRHHMFYYQSDWTDGAVRRFMNNVGIPNIRALLKLREADRIGSGKKQNRKSDAIDRLLERIEIIIEQENAITVRDLNIKGGDLIREFNLKEGIIIGRVLNYLLETILDEPEANSYEILLSKASEYIKNSLI